MTSPAPIDSRVLADTLARAVSDKKGEDIVLMDMTPVVDFTDVFLLATGANRRHVLALADEVRVVAREQFGLHALGREGTVGARWVLVDFGSVVVHIFDVKERQTYNLDALWSDAPRLPAPEADPPTA